MNSRQLATGECRALLGSKRIGRVVFTDNALPSALPVNYLLDGDTIVCRTDPWGLVAASVGPQGSVLGFQVDSIEDGDATGWSVLAVGLARQVQAPEDLARLEQSALSSGAADGTTTYLRIPVTKVTGHCLAAGDLPPPRHPPEASPTGSPLP
jgi:nitroimidazol reductase NimA-like FMN-containing flavoprotein (pyridoxamine 5'-phosphate oxidase superfamily)